MERSAMETKTGKQEWIDGHVHVIDGGIPQVEELAGLQKQYGYSHSNFLSVEGMGDAAQNAMAIYFKLLDPGHYAFGGMHYRFDYDFGKEAKKLYEIGLDGIKMIENKPTERKRLNFAQNDSRYDTLYGMLTELDMPLLAHVNDPKVFWQKDKIPQWAEEAGYFYGGGSYPAYEDILRESLDMLEAYPAMKVCFAHFLFLADDYDRLCGIMEKYPQVYLDIVPGTEMYFSFTEQPEVWRRFFLTYQDRILYGTDNANAHSEEEKYNMTVTNDMEKNFLLTDRLFPVWDKKVQGIALPEDVFRKITADNFKSFAGTAPRPVNHLAAKEYLQERLLNPAYHLTEKERDILYEVYLNCV